MDDEAYVRRLPYAYATAIRLHRNGADLRMIATALDVDVDAVPAMLELARAKLDGLVRTDGPLPAGSVE